MKKLFKSGILTGVFGVLLLSACNDRNEEAVVPNEDAAKIDLTEGKYYKACAFSAVDGHWGSFANLKTSLKTSEDTNFMINQLAKNVAVWRDSITPQLRFVEDNGLLLGIGKVKTNNAFSYPGSDNEDGKIYYGYDFFYDAKSKGGSDNIANAYLMAHEYGHQLQFNSKSLYPSQKNDDDAMELEADGFAGYYLRKPGGFNKTNFSEIAKAYEFAYSIGDISDMSGIHGTSPQRRAAVRLGFLLGAKDLSAGAFDKAFFEQYQKVQDGIEVSKNTKNSELDIYMSQYLDELKKIKNGEISAEEFKNLQ